MHNLPAPLPQAKLAIPYCTSAGKILALLQHSSSNTSFGSNGLIITGNCQLKEHLSNMTKSVLNSVTLIISKRLKRPLQNLDGQSNLH
jgi:hypothetical protein